jgi:hypothetical protein
VQTTQRALDPTPPRPDRPVAMPADVVRLRVEVSAAHLANPLVAVTRLLASEAGALARITGDETAFEVAVAASPGADTAQIEAWVRWAVHNAGVRGRTTRVG